MDGYYLANTSPGQGDIPGERNADGLDETQRNAIACILTKLAIYEGASVSGEGWKYSDDYKYILEEFKAAWPHMFGPRRGSA